MSLLFGLLFIAALSQSPLHRPDARPVSLRCPHHEWIDCRRLLPAERHAIARALLRHGAAERRECVAAREAMVRWLALESEVWTYASHGRDDARTGYILAQTAHTAMTGHPAGVGFRSSIFLESEPVIAAAALHEGAHLSGSDEAQAREIDRLCVGHVLSHKW